MDTPGETTVNGSKEEYLKKSVLGRRPFRSLEYRKKLRVVLGNGYQ